MPRQVLEHLERHSQREPQRLAVTIVAPACSAQRSMTYRELHRAIHALAARLQRVGGAGDVVMLCLPNRIEYVTAFLGALAANRTIFPVHAGATIHELRNSLQRSRASVFIGTAAHCDALAGDGLTCIDIIGCEADSDIACREAALTCDRAALMLQSSGTTGQPKIVYRSGASLDAVARNVMNAIRLDGSDQVLAAVPLCHSYGVENGLLAPILAGATIHLSDGFDPGSIARRFGTGGITVFPAVPFMIQTLAERSETIDMPSLRLAYSAGGPLPLSIAAQFHARYGVRIGQLYGSTEVGSVTFSDPSEAAFKVAAATVGRAMDGVAVHILDAEQPQIDRPLPAGREGLVAIAAPSMLDRYVDDNTPALTDGVFHTGDLGFLDDDGRLFITGRIKLQIDIGGMKVNPLEIEQVIRQHPAVNECVVVAMPVTRTLDRLKALITLRGELNGSGVEEIRQFARSHLAAHKVPRVFEIKDSLPKSPTGKILRGALRCE